MRIHLLDANVVIALAVQEHEHHHRANAWLTGVADFAVCPIVEGALVRFLTRLGERAATAQRVLELVHAMPRCTFWPDDLSYASADLGGVRGHRQVTDAYLVSLVRQRSDAVLATLDEALAATSTHAQLIPPLGPPVPPQPSQQ